MTGKFIEAFRTSAKETVMDFETWVKTLLELTDEEFNNIDPLLRDTLRTEWLSEFPQFLNDGK